MKKILTALTVGILAVAFLSAALELDFANPASTGMDSYMIENGQEDTGGNNIVTDVVFDFRGFDTLGEATVLFTTVLGVGLVFRRIKEED